MLLKRLEEPLREGGAVEFGGGIGKLCRGCWEGSDPVENNCFAQSKREIG